jgi:hypothetical protein
MGAKTRKVQGYKGEENFACGPCALRDKNFNYSVTRLFNIILQFLTPLHSHQREDEARLWYRKSWLK